MTPSDVRRIRGSRISFAVAVLVMAAKVVAFLVTGSVALLSDAAESLVNVAGSVAVIVSIRLSMRPPDYEHPYGHQKAEYLSSAFEGALIMVAAGMILVTAGGRLLDPEPLENVTAGVAIALVAMLVNGLTAAFLRREARALDSAALAANARHLLTDVWTSAGVVGGVLLVAATGLAVLDPLIAMLVALNIVREGWLVLAGSFSRLMDERLPDDEERVILRVLDGHPEVRGYHRLRSRRAGRGRFAEMDVFVDPRITVAQAHELVGELEREIHAELPDLVTTVHVEPFEVGRRDRTRAPRDEFGS